MDYVRRALWAVLYADDACIVSRSPRGLAKMMKCIEGISGAFAVTVSEKTETMCMPPPQTPPTMMRVEAAGKPKNSCNSSPTWGAPLSKVQTCHLKSPGGATHAGCASGP